MRIVWFALIVSMVPLDAGSAMPTIISSATEAACDHRRAVLCMIFLPADVSEILVPEPDQRINMSLNRVRRCQCARGESLLPQQAIRRSPIGRLVLVGDRPSQRVTRVTERFDLSSRAELNVIQQLVWPNRLQERPVTG